MLRLSVSVETTYPLSPAHPVFPTVTQTKVEPQAADAPGRLGSAHKRTAASRADLQLALDQATNGDARNTLLYQKMDARMKRCGMEAWRDAAWMHMQALPYGGFRMPPGSQRATGSGGCPLAQHATPACCVSLATAARPQRGLSEVHWFTCACVQLRGVCRVGLTMPGVEVRWQDLRVEVEAKPSKAVGAGAGWVRELDAQKTPNGWTRCHMGVKAGVGGRMNADYSS